MQLKTAAVGLFVCAAGAAPTPTFITMGNEVRWTSLFLFYFFTIDVNTVYSARNSGEHSEQVLCADTLAQALQVEQIIVATQYFLV